MSEFEFEIDDSVIIVMSGEEGLIIGSSSAFNAADKIKLIKLSITGAK